MLGVLLVLWVPAGRAVTAPQSPPPEQSERETPFDQGRVRIALSGGTAGSTGNRYFVMGAGVGVFVLDGLEVATDGHFGKMRTATELAGRLELRLQALSDGTVD